MDLLYSVYNTVTIPSKEAPLRISKLFLLRVIILNLSMADGRFCGFLFTPGFPQKSIFGNKANGTFVVGVNDSQSECSAGACDPDLPNLWCNLWFLLGTDVSQN